MQIKQRLDALTSLRFFAAAMIVTSHAAGLFGTVRGDIPTVFIQGVSFFFVLSGFILAYIYPRLETWPEIRHFWRARFARIWPAFFVSFLLAYWLLSLSWDTKIGMANLFMVHAWIPFPNYFHSYNVPSWSISAEMFFYLAFPFLIYQWQKTWLIKLLVSGAIVITLISVLNLIDQGTFVEGTIGNAILYEHPVSRIFEFIIGIWIAFYWHKRVKHNQWTTFRATLYESGVILLAVASMYSISTFVSLMPLTLGGEAATAWLKGSGSIFAFGLLIYVMAIGRGRISAWLSHPILVLLGEISFSVYLLHYMLLEYYGENFASFPHLPNLLSLAIFWTILLLSSYLMWALIEMPCRRLMLGRGAGNIHGSKVMLESWHSHLNLNRKSLSAAAILTCMVTAIYFSIGNVQRISPSDADAMTPSVLKYVVGTRFGDLFMLRGVKIMHKQEGLAIYLAWESLVEQKLTYSNGVFLTDVNGNNLINFNYKQPLHRDAEKQGDIWTDSFIFPASQLKGGERKLAIVVFQGDSDPLLVDRGERDWGSRRLLIDLADITHPVVTQ